MSPLYQAGGGAVPPLNSLRPTGAVYETFTRQGKTMANLSVLATTRLSMVAIELPSGLLISSISFLSSTTAAVLPTNQLFGLYDQGATPALLRGTVDDTTTAWAANSVKPLNLTSTYTTTRAGLFYLGILVVATTVPSLLGVGVTAVASVLPPILAGTSTTAITALPATADAITATGNCPYAWVS